MKLRFLFSFSALFLARLALAQTDLSTDTAPADDPTMTFLDEVVVTAAPLERTLFEQAQPVTVLSGKELQLRLQPTLGETLGQQPGVSSTYFGPGASRPVIRGLSDDRIRILNNGVTALDVSNVSPDHAVTLDPLTIEKVEIVRGPATLLYGPNSVGGVVNVIDNRIPDERIEPGLLDLPVRGVLESRFNSVDEERSASGLVEFGLGPVVFHLDGFKRKTEDVRIPGFARSERLRRREPLEPGEKEPRNVLPNSFTESEGGSAGASYIWERGYFGLAYSGYNSNYGTVAEPDVTIDLHQRRWDGRGAFFTPLPGIKAIRYQLTHSDYRHTEFEGEQTGTLFRIRGFDGRFELAHEKVGPFEGVIGYQTEHSDFSALGEEAFLPPTETHRHAAFLFEEIAVDAFRYQFGIRYDYTDVASSSNALFGPGDTRDFHSLSGSAGVVWTPVEAYALAFNVAYTQRAPTYVELFADGPHIATDSFEIGDRSLGLERSLGFDLTLRKQTGFVTGSASLFYNRFNDFIALSPTGAEWVGEPGEPGLPIYEFSATDADFFGGEVETIFHLITPTLETTEGLNREETLSGSTEMGSYHGLNLELRADYVHTRDRRTGRSLPRIPPFRATGALAYQYKSFGARLEAQYSARQNRTADYELPTDSYLLLNASLTYRWQAGPATIDLYLRGTNLTDEEARLHTSFLKEIAPLPGRSILVGLRTEF
ncbi:MAG TPA: TonB-dependent receptor [Chthoniobacteraceae bacterium]|nr:TonB-dependent receptor [Chthoniobacteraceae bacterium]